MAFSLTSFSPTRYAYPDRAERNPKRKTPEWIAQFCRAVVDEALRQTGFDHWYHANAKNEERLQYAFGQQTKNYDIFTTAASKETDPTGISQRIDRRILRVVPKHVRILSDKLAEREFAPSVTVVDEQAVEEEQSHLDTIRLWQEQGEFLRSQGIALPEDLPADLPQDEDDLNVYRETSYQHQDAMAMEGKLALSFDRCNYTQLDRDVVLNFFLFGDACLYCGTKDGLPVPYLIIPGNCLFMQSAYEDYRDMRQGAHIDYIDLGELKAEAGDQLSAAQYAEIERSAMGRTQDWWLPNGLAGNAADSGKVKVVRVSFLSEDDMVWKTRENKYGNRQTKRKSADYVNTTPGEVTRRTAVNVYEGTLIVGTDLSYNCRLAVKQMRDPDNPLRGLLPYVPMTPGMLLGRSSCPMDEVMPIADYIQEQWIKLQDACLRAVPQGYNFDPEVLTEAVLMLKGNKGVGDGLDLQPLIESFYRTGNSVGRTLAKDGRILPKGITKNDTGLPDDVISYWNNLRSGLQMLEAIMGSNSVVSGATPNPEVGKAQSEFALAGTLSSLGYLAHAKQEMFELICRAMGVRIWLSEEKQPITGSYRPTPGKPPVRVKPRPGLSKRTFHFSFEPKPTAQEWAQFEAILQRALDNKEITAADFADLKLVNNQKRARFLLANRAKRNEKRAAEQAARQSQMNADNLAQSGERVEAAKQKTNAEMHGYNMELETLKGRNALEVAYVYADFQHKSEQERGRARLENTSLEQEAGAQREALKDERQQARPFQEEFAALASR
jgi:hypothetical protein